VKIFDLNLINTHIDLLAVYAEVNIPIEILSLGIVATVLDDKNKFWVISFLGGGLLEISFIYEFKEQHYIIDLSISMMYSNLFLM